MSATDDVAIRAATVNDVPAMYRLLTELADTTGLPEKFVSSEADLESNGFGDMPMFESLLAEDGAGTAIGMSLFFYTYSSWRGEPGVYVQDLVVSDAARSGGIGGRLIRATANHASRRGVTHLRLSVEHGNSRAMNFYQSLGLRPCDNERLFEAGDTVFDKLASVS